MELETYAHMKKIFWKMICFSPFPHQVSRMQCNLWETQKRDKKKRERSILFIILNFRYLDIKQYLYGD